jgi:TPR repeat protein
VLARLDLKDVAPDKDKAISWYRRALEAGDDSVSDDMAALQRLNQEKTN